MKMRRIKYSTKHFQAKIQKSRFEIFYLKNDVIHDAIKVICNKNLKRLRNSVILALEIFKRKIVKLRSFFDDIGKFSDIEPAI